VVDEGESAARVDVDRWTRAAPPWLVLAEKLRGARAQLGAQRPDRERLVELTDAARVKARTLYGDSPVMGRLSGLYGNEVRDVMQPVQDFFRFTRSEGLQVLATTGRDEKEHAPQ